MRILVTGGAGFIASHVIDSFLAAGHEVAAIDNLSTGNRRNLNPAARFYELDIRDRTGVANVFEEFKPEVVDHHAAQAKVPVSIADPVLDAEINLIGGINLLRQCVDHGVRKMIFISTGGALYGEPEVAPNDEEHPLRPLSPYGTGKACFEHYLAMFKRTFGLDYTSLRYGNVYGPRQDLNAEGGRVVAIFAERVLRDQPLTIDGTGEQARDMIYVDDVVRANLIALHAGSGEAYNVGTGIPSTVNQIFRRLAELSGYQREPRYGPPRPGEVFRIALDSSKAARDLGWRAEVSLDDGLARTLAALRHDLALA